LSVQRILKNALLTRKVERQCCQLFATVIGYKSDKNFVAIEEKVDRSQYFLKEPNKLSFTQVTAAT
jgi:hypothetical protein